MSADRVEEIWGKDHNRVVIDEVAGMCITLLFVPLKWQYTLIGLVLLVKLPVVTYPKVLKPTPVYR